MIQPNFPGNSKRPPKPEAEEKKVERVVVTDAVAQKRGLGRRLKEVLIGGDSRSVTHYVMAEVIIPQVKDLLSEALTQGFQRMIYGDGPSRRGSGRPGLLNSRYTNYGQYAGRGNQPIGRATTREERTPATLQSKMVDDILLATRVEADAVLEQMYDLLEKYENVSIADLYAMINWAPTHNDNKWGWLDLHGSGVKMVGNGYVLQLPKPVSLD